MGRFVIGFSWLCLSACGPVFDQRPFPFLDLTPPVLLELRTLDKRSIEIVFSEPVFFHPESLIVQPPLTTPAVRSSGPQIVIGTDHQVSGREYTLEGTVEDEKRNSLSFIALFYGHNAEVPEVLINEFTTRGSSTHPDIVELKVLSGGDMGGLILLQGTPNNWTDRLVFPSFSVDSDDFIVVHFKPQGILEEINETTEKDLSGGLDASDEAFDYWVEGGTGLSGNNGVITLLERPGGCLLDGVLYSNRTSQSDEKYLGFGTRTAMERALELAAMNGWTCGEDRVRPEDAVNPEGSTATRSLCRKRGNDSNSRNDWYIVPTRHASFGKENSEEVYNP